jgi:hypothetical protein
MAFFDNFQSEKPTKVSSVELYMRKDSSKYELQYIVSIEYNDGLTRCHSGNLVPHLTAQQATALENLATQMLNLATAKIATIA